MEKKKKNEKKQNINIAIFSGCLHDFIYPEQFETFVDIVDKFHISVDFPENQICCGLPFKILGEFEKEKNIMVVESRTVQMNIHDINTKETSSITLPRIIFGLKFATLSYENIDSVGKYITLEVSVYQIYHDKFIKISSSKNNNGSRQVGEYYTLNSEIFKKVMEDKPVMFLIKKQ